MTKNNRVAQNITGSITVTKKKTKLEQLLCETDTSRVCLDRQSLESIPLDWKGF